MDEPRLRREIPPPIFERLQRELLNPTFLSEPDFAAPPNTAAIGSRSSSSSSCYGSRNGRNSAGAISRRLGATGPASSNGLVTSTGLGSTSSTASGAGVGSGYDGDVPVSGGGEGLPRRRGEDGGAGNRWMGAGGESWRWKGDAGGRRERGGDGCVADDGIGFTGGLSSGSVSSPPKSHRSPPHSSPRFRNRAEADEVRFISGTLGSESVGQKKHGSDRHTTIHACASHRTTGYSATARERMAETHENGNRTTPTARKNRDLQPDRDRRLPVRPRRGKAFPASAASAATRKGGRARGSVVEK